ncbi:MAG: thioredoxin domain-containing protein [Nitrospirales bacterium]|nr:MAG: thioredoxin domain-containing protein [Nitrospirales bacterium]
MASRFPDNFFPSRPPLLNIVSKVVFILCLTVSVFIFGEHTAFSHQTKPDHQSGLQWHEWGQEAFDRAQVEDKLILLDLTAVWCHACHVMDQTTYADPKVMALLQTNFIPVRVDTDQRPDLEARYRKGGWPTTSLLLPTGEILFQANSLEPEVMLELLQEARLLYDSEKEDLRQQAAQLWNRVKDRRQTNQSPSGALHHSMARHSVEMMKKEFDFVNGGFRDHPKFFEPEAIQVALTYGFFENDVELINMGLTTLEKQVALLDPVWGGFYRYAEQADWSQPHFEKMLTVQAQNLHNYVRAFQFTGNTEFQYIAERIIDYVETFLFDHRTGQFFESQDADVRGQDGKTLVPGAEYFSWGTIHRMARGMPLVDRRMYTGSNADMAWAYLHAAQVLGKTELEERALKVLQRIMEERFDEEKGLAHGASNDSLQLYGMLSDHIRLGLALVEAFRATEDFTYLQHAEALAQVNQRLLEDTKGGGFFDLPHSSENLGLLNIPTKPARENIQAVRWYVDLFHLTGKDEYRSTAERTLQLIMGTPQLLPIALIGLAVDEWFRPPVHIAVVGMPDDNVTQALWKAGQRLYCPRKMVKMIHPQQGLLKWGEVTFPYEGRPAVFICTDQICLAPMYQAEGMSERLSELFTILRKPVL